MGFGLLLPPAILLFFIFFGGGRPSLRAPIRLLGSGTVEVDSSPREGESIGIGGGREERTTNERTSNLLGVSGLAVGRLRALYSSTYSTGRRSGVRVRTLVLPYPVLDSVSTGHMILNSIDILGNGYGKVLYGLLLFPLLVSSLWGRPRSFIHSFPLPFSFGIKLASGTYNPL